MIIPQDTILQIFRSHIGKTSRRRYPLLLFPSQTIIFYQVMVGYKNSSTIGSITLREIEFTPKPVIECYFIIVFFFILLKRCPYINIIMFSRYGRQCIFYSSKSTCTNRS